MSAIAAWNFALNCRGVVLLWTSYPPKESIAVFPGTKSMIAKDSATVLSQQASQAYTLGSGIWDRSRTTDMVLTLCVRRLTDSGVG